MILESLVRHYDQLAERPDSGIAAYGFAIQKVAFCIVLRPDGAVHAIEDRRVGSGTDRHPIKIKLPYPGGKRTSGIKPYLSWDKSAYVLGRDSTIEKTGDSKKLDRLLMQFVAFRETHLEIESEIGSEPFSATCRFLEKWDPKHLDRYADAANIASANLVFSIQGSKSFLHEDPAFLDYWKKSIEPAKGGRHSFCLVSGVRSPIARTHTPIKGIRDSGGQAEKSIVSFNKTSFESLGFQQAYNAPISEESAFRYTAALNHLLADRFHRVTLGDTTCVFWVSNNAEADDPDPADALADSLGFFTEMSASPDSKAVEVGGALREFLGRYREGIAAGSAEDLEHSASAFYVLGMAPNAARISVRFWLQCTVFELAQRLERHYSLLQVVGLREGIAPTLWQLIRSTAREWKEVKPNVAGEMTRAFLHGGPIPRSFIQSLLLRLRVDGDVTPVRAAGLKAYVLSNEISVMTPYLNREHPSAAYHSGRILSILDFAQREALPNVNAGVVKKYFASAMSMPGLMLGRLQQAAEVGHLRKLSDQLATFIHDELTSANCCLRDGPPKRLGSDGQTLFALGFYQQTAYLNVVKSQVKGNRRHRSSQGEWMRSKLEVRVAEAMNKLGIEYVYEPSAILADAGERWPDFVVRGGDASRDTYIEVAGYPGEDYDKRHCLKLKAYEKMNILEGGGEGGRLVVLDYRETPFDEMSVSKALQFLNTTKSANIAEEA